MAKKDPERSTKLRSRRPKEKRRRSGIFSLFLPPGGRQLFTFFSARSPGENPRPADQRPY
ncbi:hypothetical protein CLOLEP_01104 [[Clostridium] leptum DSM 753]|uniref:Uncharacterized protein n=1 Tax=[Clostridium] leptum DSM 753 TaxID=428125 RepID=A7VRC2_9FIRM|nr:hypothetical protein CLOLEP_01104 [[Clostridium] leptum DSM 753]